MASSKLSNSQGRVDRDGLKIVPQPLCLEPRGGRGRERLLGRGGVKGGSPGPDQPERWAQQKQGLSRESSPRWCSSPRQPLPLRGLAHDTETSLLLSAPPPHPPSPHFLQSLSTAGSPLYAVRKHLESRGAVQVCGLCIRAYVLRSRLCCMCLRVCMALCVNVHVCGLCCLSPNFPQLLSGQSAHCGEGSSEVLLVSTLSFLPGVW